MNIVALIPARSGSKGLPNKNIKYFRGKPLIAHSIEQALGSKFINKVIVSTDSAEYMTIAKQFGAEVPFVRPLEISGDLSLDIEVFKHCDNYLQEIEYITDLYVHLRPTYPIRTSIQIDECIQMLLENPNSECVRSVSISDISPFKTYLKKENSNIIYPSATCHIPEAHNAPRQILPPAFIHNGCIDVIRRETIASGSMTGKNILGYLMDHNYDIDTLEDFLNAEKQ
jgi:CMP-N-acetylneuraminic acid synthetase